MKNPPLNTNYLTPKQRESAINKIIDYFATEQNIELGYIAAEDLLELFLAEVGPEIFNQGIDQAKKIFETNFQENVLDLDMIRKDN